MYLKKNDNNVALTKIKNYKNKKIEIIKIFILVAMSKFYFFDYFYAMSFDVDE